MNYVQANLYAKRKKLEEEAFKIYVAEAVKNINHILAENFSGSYMKLSYTEMIHPKPVETRTADEIINDIRNGLKRLN